MSNKRFFNRSRFINNSYDISVYLRVSVYIGIININRRNGCFAVFVRNITFRIFCFIRENNCHILNRFILAVCDSSSNSICNVNQYTLRKHNIYLSFAYSNKGVFNRLCFICD